MSPVSKSLRVGSGESSSRKSSCLAKLKAKKVCKKCKGNVFYKDGHCALCARTRAAKRYSLIPAVINELSKKWQREHLEQFKKVKARYRMLRPEVQKNAIAKWQAANPEKVRLSSYNMSARRRAAVGRLSKGIAEKLFALQKGKCACCGKPLGDGYHLDHIMPIALGGANEDRNVQLLRQVCNNQKHAKHPIDFMRSRGFLL